MNSERCPKVRVMAGKPGKQRVSFSLKATDAWFLRMAAEQVKEANPNEWRSVETIMQLIAKHAAVHVARAMIRQQTTKFNAAVELHETDTDWDEYWDKLQWVRSKNKSRFMRFWPRWESRS